MRAALGASRKRKERITNFEQSKYFAGYEDPGEHLEGVINYGYTILPDTKPKTEKGVVGAAYNESMATIALLNSNKNYSSISEREYNDVYSTVVSKTDIDVDDPRGSMERLLRNTAIETAERQSAEDLKSKYPKRASSFERAMKQTKYLSDNPR